MDDLSSIDDVLSGNKQQFRVLVERYEHKIYSFVLKIVNDPGLAEDVTQETFLAAYRGLGHYDKTRPFSTWLYAIAKHGAYKMIKAKGWMDVVPNEDLSHISSEKDQIESQVIQREVNFELLQSLQSLTDEQNLLLTLRYFEDLSPAEISLRLGLPKKKVENILFNSKQKLKSILVQTQKGDCQYAKSI